MGLEHLFKPRICELGKIKIGRKEERVRQAASGPWRAPEKIDHFLITTLNRTPAGDLVNDDALMAELAAEHAGLDGKLRQIPIFVLSNEIEDVLQSAWVCYAGKRIAAKSDGVKLTKYIDIKSGEVCSPPVESEWKPEFADATIGERRAPLFKLHSTFNCVIASKAGRWGGVYKFRTTSRISGEQLYGSLLHVKQLTGGVLRGLPLRLVVRPLQVQPDGKATTVYVVHAELRGADLHEIQQRALEQKRYEVEHISEIRKADEQYRMLLRAPGESEDDAEAAEVVEEFHPESIEAEPTAAPSEPDPPLGDEPFDHEESARIDAEIAAQERGE